MKAPPVMLIKGILLYILLVTLAQSNYQVYAFIKEYLRTDATLHQGPQQAGFDGSGSSAEIQEKSANVLTVSPENTTRISEESQESGNYKILHIIYASTFVGLCFPFIVACMFWCLRRSHAKQKRTPLTQQKQESLVSHQTATPSHAAGTTQGSEASSSLYYCSIASPLQASHINIVYDNNVLPWNTQRTAPDASRNNPVIPSILALPESPDVLTYAALNHSASAERCQTRKLTVENEFTEYASIKVNK